MYERRTIRSNCRNGLRYVRKISVENCECARSDYICDFGFRKDAAWTESCVKNPDFGHDPYAVPSDCKPGRFYNRTRGYVKIRGDTCAGGRRLSIARGVGEWNESVHTGRDPGLLIGSPTHATSW